MKRESPPSKRSERWRGSIYKFKEELALPRVGFVGKPSIGHHFY